MAKPHIGLLLGLKPDHDGDGDGDEDDYSKEGLQKACEEFFEAAGIEVPEEKKEAACEALTAFVHLAMSAPPKDEDEDEDGETETPEGENECAPRSRFSSFRTACSRGPISNTHRTRRW